MKLTHRFAEPDKRLQDPYMDGTGLRFETMEHGGNISIRCRKPSSSSTPRAVIPSPEDAFPHCGFFDPKVPLSSLLYISRGTKSPSRVSALGGRRIRGRRVKQGLFVNQVASFSICQETQTPSLLPS